MKGKLLSHIQSVTITVHPGTTVNEGTRAALQLAQELDISETYLVHNERKYKVELKVTQV